MFTQMLLKLMYSSKHNNLTGLITLLTYVFQDNCKWADGRHQNKVYRLPHLFSPLGHARLAALANFLVCLAPLGSFLAGYNIL